MTVIQERDLIDSVADALQFISYYHPLDFIQAVHRAWEREQNPAVVGASMNWSKANSFSIPTFPNLKLKINELK